MGSSATVPMIAPNGQSGDVPFANVEAAKAQGFKVALEMTAPNGQTGYIPADRQADALKAGFKMHPTTSQAAPAPSFWEALTNPVGSGGAQQGVIGGAQQIGGQAIKTAAQPFAHPIDTLSALGGAIMHPINTVEGMEQNFRNDMQQGGVPLAVENAAGQLIGGVEGGRIAGAVARPVASVATKAGARALLAGETPEAAYETALKPPPASVSAADRAQMVQTGLKNSIPVSKGGLEKLGDLINDFDAKRQAVIDADPTRTISTVGAVRNLDAVRARFANQVTPQPDMAEIDSVQSNFLNNPKIAPQGAGPSPGSLTAAEAQAMKTGTYRALGNKSYGEVKGASIEAQKALARGLKDELANAFPELQNLNAAESKLLDLEPVLERAVNRIGNHQAFGIGTPLMGAGMKAATGSNLAAAAAATYKAIVDNPIVKSRLAIAVSKGGRIPLAQAMARVNALSASLGSAVSAPQEYSSGASPTQ